MKLCYEGNRNHRQYTLSQLDNNGTKNLPVFPDENVVLSVRDKADKENCSKKAKNCGLVSISFRNKSPEEIVTAMKNAGLTHIEWGSDVHVPEGNLEKAEAIRKLCKENGIKISSYGTYYKLGQNQDITPYLLSAKVLGTPILRIWAGTTGSCDVDRKLREELVLEAKSVCKKAAEYGLKIDFEYHPGTLTDDAQSAYSLIQEINEPNCGIYWQPNYAKSFGENIDALKKVLPYVDIIHIFYWDKDGKRLFLKDGQEQVAEYLKIAKDKFFLLEFVPEDKIEHLKGEANTLFEIIEMD